jgi:hypothetical protein
VGIEGKKGLFLLIEDGIIIFKGENVEDGF